MTEHQAAKGQLKEDVERLRDLYFIDGGGPKQTVADFRQPNDRSTRDRIADFMEQHPGIHPNLTRGVEQELDTIRDME